MLTISPTHTRASTAKYLPTHAKTSAVWMVEIVTKATVFVSVDLEDWNARVRPILAEASSVSMADFVKSASANALMDLEAFSAKSLPIHAKI